MIRFLFAVFVIVPLVVGLYVGLGVSVYVGTAVALQK